MVVINLDRSRDRWAAFQQANDKHVVYERFRACDGKDLSRAELEKTGVIRPDLVYTSGAIGNAVSHISLWQRTVSQGQNLTICEDDAIFNRGFAAWSEKLLNQLAGNFDFILWGWNFDAVMTYDMLPGVSHSSAIFDQAALRNSLDRFQSLGFTPSFYRLRCAFGLPCYTISPHGAALLLKTCLPLAPMRVKFPGCQEPMTNTAIDIAMSVLYPSMRAFVPLPPLVVTPNVHEISTVQREGSEPPSGFPAGTTR